MRLVPGGAGDGPTPGFNNVEAYDPATGQTILFVGDNGSALQTWNWNGYQLGPAQPRRPALRPADFTTMAYDAATSQLLLFGG